MFKYAYWEGCPVRFDPEGVGKAWVFGKGKWVDLDIADACVKAKLLTEADYNQMFPDLPPLPDRDA